MKRMHWIVAGVVLAGALTGAGLTEGWWRWGLGLIAAGGAVAALMRATLIKDLEDRRAFRDRVLGDVAEWLAPKLGRDRTEIRRSLDRLGAAEGDGLAELIRIECGIAKGGDAGEFTVASSVLVLNGEKSILEGRVTRKMPWTQLPSEIRSEFIRGGSESLRRVLFQRADVAL
jgi:hypothetical protein